MPGTLACSQGHRWELSSPRQAPRGRQQMICPVCGGPPVAEPAEAPRQVLQPTRKPAPEVVEVQPAVAVDLGPRLPMSVFTSTEMWRAERVHALALYCSDGRWGEAFDDFCHRHLLIPQYDRFAVPGGPAWLVPVDPTKDHQQVARDHLTLLVRIHELKRIVLITHYGCAVYAERLKKDPDGSLPTQMEDLQTATTTLHQWFPDVRVEAYVAMRTGNSLSFHGLTK